MYAKSGHLAYAILLHTWFMDVPFDLYISLLSASI